MYDVYGHYFAINMLIMRDELSKSFFMLPAIDAEQMMMWDDGMMSEGERETDRVCCVWNNHIQTLLMTTGVLTHTYVCTHTQKHNSKIGMGKKRDRKRLGWFTFNMERGKKGDLSLSLCSHSVSLQSLAKLNRYKGTNTGKIWLSIYILYIALDWWEYILTLMFCLGS